ncbi:MAG: 3-phosphoshikimate 1-carboxyvinyltransferase [Bacteroidales bacterium]|nr:3-phosphoshikimate 1-carboxyvinyltransferase [Bacteroidales bacterium]
MKIIGANSDFDVTVNLVGSKSESNRALMIAHYGGFTPRINNLSTSDDTVLLSEIINGINVKTRFIANCSNAGTVFRFLATALAFRDGDYILTGSDRMMQRPVGDLVYALRAIGADIEYIGQEGFPPLKICGRQFVETFPETSPETSPIHVNITHSSQFASSILLALPTIETRNGTSLHLDGNLSSLPYIDMTIDMMRKFGAIVNRDGRDIFVKHSDYHDVEYCVESDWTCASYWYEAVALSDNGRARLRNLRLDSKQGDAVVAKWFENFGVKTVQYGNDIIITHVETDANPSPVRMDANPSLRFDFINNPDLFPTIAATCAGLHVEGHFTGLRNLVHKESDRVAAMIDELSKIGVKFEKISNDELIVTPVETFPETSLEIVFNPHNDHRIAMSLAPLATKIGVLEIENADVVSKSYPNFWEEFNSILSSIHQQCE